MKKEQGVILSTEGKIAHIRVGRHEECSGCGACPSARHVMIDAVNPLGAVKGQRVSFEFREEQMLLGAFVVFLLPLLSAGMGAFFGWEIAILQGMAEYEASFSIAGAAMAFLVSLIVVKLFDRKAARDKRKKPVIVEIL